MNQEEQLKLHGKSALDALTPIVKWKYDNFHKVMLAEFSVDKEEQVLITLQQIFPDSWDAKSIKKAPPKVKHYAGPFAKLVKKQKLLSANPDNHPRVMAAWWPWGHGATVSVRLFLTNTEPYVEETSLFSKLRNLFA
ncbi:hypothetical protein [Paraglaciecola sp. 2405UD69-4]|uniref:hypothetical protein n=1 Tax=Paraglaciecola sp. 2405UD69-4 TaxID=3391836 RepID=UPI0039C8CB1C